MNKIIFCAILTVFLACNCGCSYHFDIIVDDLGSVQPTFKFSKPLFASPKGVKNRIELNSFRVVEKKGGTWDYKNPMWAFGLKPGAALVVDHIRHGAVPGGFTETTKAKPLLVGVSYLAIGFGLGSGGSQEFVLIEPK